MRARAGNHGEIPGRELRCAGETDLSGGPGGAARRKGRVTRVACERAAARVRAGPRAKGAGMLGRCEAGAGEGRAEEGVKRAGRK